MHDITRSETCKLKEYLKCFYHLMSQGEALSTSLSKTQGRNQQAESRAQAEWGRLDAHVVPNHFADFV